MKERRAEPRIPAWSRAQLRWHRAEVREAVTVLDLSLGGAAVVASPFDDTGGEYFTLLLGPNVNEAFAMQVVSRERRAMGIIYHCRFLAQPKHSRQRLDRIVTLWARDIEWRGRAAG